MSCDYCNVSYCIRYHDNVTQFMGNTAEANKKMSESEALNRYLAAIQSLLKLSVRKLYTENILRIERHTLFDCTYINDTLSKLEDCRVGLEFTAWILEEWENNSENIGREEAKAVL